MIRGAPRSTPFPYTTLFRSGVHFDFQNLNKVTSELATAVAGGTSTTQAQADFTTLFSGSSVSTSVINTTFTDLIKTTGASHVTTPALTTIPANEAPIHTNLS